MDDYDRLHKDNFQLSYGRALSGEQVVGKLRKSKNVKEVKGFPKTKIFELI